MINFLQSNTKKITLYVLLAFGVSLFIPTFAHAEINMQGLAGAIIQCTAGGKKSAKGSLSEQNAVKTEADSTKATKEKETCGDAIAKYAITELLAKVTQETLNWINGGFKGDPSFLQNPEAYAKSIATQKRSELKSIFGSDDESFPYGRAAMQAMIKSELNKGTAGLRKRATFTMNNYVPTGDVSDFYKDFRIGGWDALFAQSFQQQNNPVGFALLAAEEEERVTAGEDKSEIERAEEEINRNDGFLNQKICKESHHPSGRYDPPENTNGGVFTEADWIAIANDKGRPDSERENARKHICKTWVTKTPGTVIAHALNKTIIDVPLDQAIAADEINESLNVVFSALMQQAFQNGASSLENLTSEVDSGLNSVGLGFLTDPTQLFGGGSGNSQFFGGLGTNAEDIETATQTNPWIQMGSNFDLGKELPYLIYLQKRYLGDPTLSLPIDPDTGSVYIDVNTGAPYTDPAPGFGGIPALQSVLYETILKLEDLDFCIPGPSPFFPQKVQARIASSEEQIRNALGSMTQIQNIMDPSGLAAGQATETAENAIKLLYDVGNQFVSKLNDKFRTDLQGNMPFVTEAAKIKINDIPRYIELREENRAVVLETEDVLHTLVFLQSQLEDLEDQAVSLSGGGQITPAVQDQLELQANVILNSFYSVAGEVVREEDLLELLAETNSASGSTGVIESMTTQCRAERADPDYTGQRNQIPYQSISGEVITFYPGQISGSVNHFLIPNVDLDYGLDSAQAVIDMILAVLSGGVLGSFNSATVFTSLDVVNVAGFDGWDAGTSWFETWTGIQ